MTLQDQPTAEEVANAWAAIQESTAALRAAREALADEHASTQVLMVEHEVTRHAYAVCALERDAMRRLLVTCVSYNLPSFLLKRIRGMLERTTANH